MQFLPHESRFTNKSTMKSIKMWNHRLFGTGKNFKTPWYLSRFFEFFFAIIKSFAETFDVVYYRWLIIITIENFVRFRSIWVPCSWVVVKFFDQTELQFTNVRSELFIFKKYPAVDNDCFW